MSNSKELTDLVSGGKLNDSIGQNVSILVDEDIKILAENKKLIRENYSEDSIKYASYMLRVSNTISVIQSNSEGVLGPHKKNIDDSGYISILPNQTIQLYTYEKISLPTNVIARINVVGQIFAAGLFAENTFADPGFGLSNPMPIYITVVNVTAKIIKVPIHSNLARIEFYRIGEGVKKPFSGEPSPLMLEYQNAFADLINSPRQEGQKELLTEFSNQLKDYKDEGRCISHFSIAQKIIDESIQETKELRTTLYKVRLGIWFISFIIISIIVFLVVPNQYKWTSIFPAIVSIVLSIFKKETKELFFKDNK